MCHLLALLGAHHIFHVSGLKVKKQFAHLDRIKISILFCLRPNVLR
jgi:hypothetical protein